MAWRLLPAQAVPVVFFCKSKALLFRSALAWLFDVLVFAPFGPGLGRQEAPLTGIL